MTSSSPSRRRWFQISLRTLFLLILLIAAYFGGLATARRQAEKALEAERKARAELETRVRATEREAMLQQLLAEKNALQAQIAQQAAMVEAQTRLQLEMLRQAERKAIVKSGIPQSAAKPAKN